MKIKYNSPDIEIVEADDVVSTSEQSETGKIPVESPSSSAYEE